MDSENRKEEVEEIKSGKKNATKTKKITIGIIIGIIVLVIIAVLVCFFNQKYEVVFDYNNGSNEEVIYVKYNKTILNEKIKSKKELGNLFLGWYEIIEKKDGNDILSEKPFDFTKKISKKTNLKAMYNEEVEKIVITFNSAGGSDVDSLTIEKGSHLELPKNPTKDGYTFIAWKTESEIPITDGANLSESMTLYASWEKQETATNKKKNSTTSTSNKTYYCESGYTIVGTQCSKTEMIEATLANETCPNNYSKQGSICIANAVTSYATAKCPAGTTQQRPGYNYCYSEVIQTDEYTCTNYKNGKYTNGHCYLGTSKEVEYVCPISFSMIVNYSASADKLHECHKEAATLKTYSCPNGYTSTSGSQCIKVITKDALVK